MSKKLYIIGNGFDLHHGMKSSYAAFREYLVETNPQLLLNLYLFFDPSDIWGDFEGNLAYLSRERLMEHADVYLRGLDLESEDFKYADYYMLIDIVQHIIYSFLDNLHYHFYKWIRTLKLPMEHKYKMLKIDRGAKFISFNYTDTLEQVYEIPKTQIIYLHGNKNGGHKNIVLGHGSDSEKSIEEWYHKNKNKRRFRPNLKNKRGKYYANNRLTYLAYFLEEEEKKNKENELRYYAVDNLIEIIEEYYEASRKKSDEVISKHKLSFKILRDVEEIIVLGHSLHSVDHAYFKEIIKNHKAPEKIQWKISYYSEKGKQENYKFIETMGINKLNTCIFNINKKLIQQG